LAPAGSSQGRRGLGGPPRQARAPAMIIVLRPHSTREQIDHILDRIRELGFKAHLSQGELRTIIGVIGDENKLQAEPLSAIPGVEQVLPILTPFKPTSPELHAAASVPPGGKGRGGGARVGMTARPSA